MKQETHMQGFHFKRAEYWAAFQAVRMISLAWFDYLEERFLIRCLHQKVFAFL